MQSVNVKWEKRMANLNENWEASRPLIFKTIILLGVMNGPLKFLTACKILPLLDLLAKTWMKQDLKLLQMSPWPCPVGSKYVPG